MKCGRLVRLWGSRSLISAVFVPCFPFSLPSVTEWSRTMLSCLDGHDDGKNITATVFPPIYRTVCMVSIHFQPGLFPRTFDVFYSPDVTAAQARWSHSHIPHMRSSRARFSGSAGEALSSSSLCHCWHLWSFCCRVCVGFVGGLLQCHPSKAACHKPNTRLCRSWEYSEVYVKLALGGF